MLNLSLASAQSPLPHSSAFVTGCRFEKYGLPVEKIAKLYKKSKKGKKETEFQLTSKSDISTQCLKENKIATSLLGSVVRLYKNCVSSP